MNNNIEKMQNKINAKFPLEQIQVLEANGAKGCLKYQCLTCGKIYTFKKGENAYSKKKQYGCHECGSLYQKRANFKNKLVNSFPQDSLEIINFSTRDKECLIKCKTCNTEYYFSCAANVFKKTRNKFCQKCFPFKEEQRKNLHQRFIEWLNSQTQWKLMDSLNDKKSADLITCKCLLCGKNMKRTMNDFMRNRKCTCENHATPITPQQFQEIIEDEFELLTSYKNIYSKVKIRHKNCGFVREVTARQIWTKGCSCPKCSKKRSRGEKKIIQYFEQHNINFIQEYPIKVENHILRIDFYLPDYDLYIEFNGQQHYEPISYFGGERRFKIQQKYDQMKKDTLKDKLYVISYKDMNKIAMLLDKLLSSTTNL